MKHASFPCDLFMIEMIGYRHEIVRLPVVFQRRRLQVFVKNRTHQSRRFCQQHTDPIRYTPICEQSRSPCFVLLADRATKLFGITLRWLPRVFLRLISARYHCLPNVSDNSAFINDASNPKKKRNHFST